MSTSAREVNIGVMGQLLARRQLCGSRQGRAQLEVRELLEELQQAQARTAQVPFLTCGSEKTWASFFLKNKCGLNSFSIPFCP